MKACAASDVELFALIVAIIFAALIRLAPHFAKIKLAGHRYNSIFEHLRHVWAGTVNLMPETAPPGFGESFVGINIESYTRIIVRGLPFGVAKKHRGRHYCFAYIEGRQPVRIAHIYHVVHQRMDPTQPPPPLPIHALWCNACAEEMIFLPCLGRCGQSSLLSSIPNILLLANIFRAADLGITMWHDAYEPPEVIPATSLCGHWIRAHIRHNQRWYCVAISTDHVSATLFVSDLLK